MNYAPKERSARLAFGLLLAVSCALLLRPFFSAILFAIVIAVSGWPAYQRLLALLGRRRSLASTLACVIVVVVVVVPLIITALSIGDGASWLLGLLDDWRERGGGQPPDWLARVPLLGDALRRGWLDVASDPARLRGLLGAFAEPARELALASGRALANALLQSMLIVVLLFHLLRDGEQIAAQVVATVARVGGQRGGELLGTAQRTVVGVMVSVLGTSLAQALVAALGFTIAGIPNPPLLAALTFVLSMAPVGPPIIWGGATLWLLSRDQTGWAAFMGLYGLLGISSVDNVLKPFLISRSSHLPFVLTLFGVIGGVFAFGVVGAFLGPTLLALAVDLYDRGVSGLADGDAATEPRVDRDQ